MLNPLNHYARTLFRQKYSLQKHKIERIPNLGFKPRILFDQMTFQPKIFRLKMSKSREFQTSSAESAESLCSDTFQPKIFRLKMSGLGGLLGKNLSYPSEMSKEMSILAFARGSFKT